MFEGVKTTERVCAPASSIVPDAGVYTRVPVTFAPLKLDVASSCVLLSAVPYVMAAGVAQVIVGLEEVTCSATDAFAVL